MCHCRHVASWSFEMMDIAKDGYQLTGYEHIAMEHHKESVYSVHIDSFTSLTCHRQSMMSNAKTNPDLMNNANQTATAQPFAYIVEQPAKCGVRFRYECEGRISSAIPGASSSTARFTYPAIAVANYTGPVKVIVSCVTKNAPHRPHPHNLVGKKYCQQGICMAIFPEAFCQFTNLGILCAKRKDVKERLRTREQLQVDPFNTGFSHKSHTSKLIDLNVVRLCFQVLLPDSVSGQFCLPLEPIVSDEIFDKKAMSELSISKLSHYSSSARGGQSIIMLCDRVLKDDIQVRFFSNDSNGHLTWEKFAQFSSSYDLDMGHKERVAVKVQLRRPSDGCVSEPVTFHYTLQNNNDFETTSMESDSDQSIGHEKESFLSNSHGNIYMLHGELDKCETEKFGADEQFNDGNFVYSDLTTQYWQTFTGDLETNVMVKCEFDQYQAHSSHSVIPQTFNTFNANQFKGMTQTSTQEQSDVYSQLSATPQSQTILDISQNHARILRTTEFQTES